MKHIIFLSLGLLVFLSGCGNTDDPEFYKIEKCRRASSYLEHNFAQMNAAMDWKSESIPKSTSMHEEVERRKLLGRIMLDFSEDGQMSRKKMLDWYKSDYCQNILSEHQNIIKKSAADFELEVTQKKMVTEKNTADKIAYYSKSMVNPETKISSCKKYKDQYAFIAEIGLSKNHHSGLIDGLKNTLRDSTEKLKIFQKKRLEEMLTKDDGLGVAQEIYNNCPDDIALSDQLANLKSIKNMKSDRTLGFYSKAQEFKSGTRCDDELDFLCQSKINLQAVRFAIQKSIECDEIDNSTPECKIEDTDFLNAEIKKVTLTALETRRERLERYIKNPGASRDFNSANYQGNVSLLMESCNRAAVKSGLHGAAYYEHKKNVCEPEAILKFTKPQRDELLEIINRINNIN